MHSRRYSGSNDSSSRTWHLVCHTIWKTFWLEKNWKSFFSRAAGTIVEDNFATRADLGLFIVLLFFCAWTKTIFLDSNGRNRKTKRRATVHFSLHLQATPCMQKVGELWVQKNETPWVRFLSCSLLCVKTGEIASPRMWSVFTLR